MLNFGGVLLLIIKYFGGGSLSRYPSAGAVQLAALGAWLVGGKPSGWAETQKDRIIYRSEAMLVLGSVFERSSKVEIPNCINGNFFRL